MGDDRDPRDAVVFADKSDSAFELAAGVLRTAERFTLSAGSSISG